MNTIELFKNNLTAGIWQHAKKLFKPVVIIGVAYMVLVGVLAFFGMSAILGGELTEELFMSGTTGFDMNTMMERNQRLTELFLSNGSSIMSGLLLMYVVLGLIGSWFTNFMLMISQNALEQESVDIGGVFGKSFNGNVFKIFIYIIASVVTFGIVAAAVLFALMKISGLLFFVGYLAVIIFAFRLVAGPAAIVHGDMGVMDAFKFSWANITFGRAFKLFVAMIVFVILFAIVFAIIGGFLGAMGSSGFIILMILQLVIGVLLYAITYAAWSASFYRYAEVETTAEADDHLISEE